MLAADFPQWFHLCVGGLHKQGFSAIAPATTPP